MHRHPPITIPLQLPATATTLPIPATPTIVVARRMIPVAVTLAHATVVAEAVAATNQPNSKEAPTPSRGGILGDLKR